MTLACFFNGSVLGYLGSLCFYDSTYHSSRCAWTYGFFLYSPSSTDNLFLISKNWFQGMKAKSKWKIMHFKSFYNNTNVWAKITTKESMESSLWFLYYFSINCYIIKPILSLLSPIANMGIFQKINPSTTKFKLTVLLAIVLINFQIKRAMYS
jgi:hypothetical protein